MKEDITKIITMLQAGKINADEAEELISALKSEPEEKSKKPYLGKMFKVRIKSGTKDNVNVNIPVKLVKTVLKMGHGIAASIPQAKEYVDDLDMDVIMHALDNEVDGKIVDIQAENGDLVAVYIE